MKIRKAYQCNSPPRHPERSARHPERSEGSPVGQLIEVPAQYTSQRCSRCQHTAKENRLTQAQFVCTKCKQQMNADINAAKNILAAGHAVLACGASAVARLRSKNPLRY